MDLYLNVFHSSGKRSPTPKIHGQRRLVQVLWVARMLLVTLKFGDLVTISSRCQFPQITSDGLQDSIEHGSVYELYISYDTYSKSNSRTSDQFTRRDLVSALLLTRLKLKSVCSSHKFNREYGNNPKRV